MAEQKYYECDEHGVFQSTAPKCANCSEVKRATWLTRYNAEKDGPNFDAKKFAGKLAFERVAIAKKAIHSIASPFLSNDADLPCGEAGIQNIEDELACAVEMLVNELRAGKRSSVRMVGCIDMG